MTHPVHGILPEDLMMEIISKIPARFLVSLRCVCKSWNALITDPQFVSKFFNRHNTRKIFLCRSYDCRHVALFRFYEQPRILYDSDPMAGLKLYSFEKNLYFLDRFRACIVAGSINGIICLFSCWKYDTSFVVLWNPAIDYWKLIYLPLHEDDDGHESIGLAYDSLTNDYKIIRLASLSKPSYPTTRIEVYSAKQDSWSVVYSQIPFLSIRPTCSLILKGVPYWSRNYVDYRRSFIASVDPHTGSYKKIPYPQTLLNQKICVHLFNLMDSLALLIYYPGDQTFHVYALDDENSCATTWTILYTTAIPTVLQIKDICILQCFEDAGKTVVVGWNKHQRDSFLYDLKSDCLIDSIALDVFRPEWKVSYHDHVESLVYIPGMKPIQTEDDNYIELPMEENMDQ